MPNDGDGDGQAGLQPVADAPAPPPKPSAFSRLGWRTRVLIGVPLTLALIATIFVAIALIRYTIRFPDPMALHKREVAPVVRILARDGSVMAERGQNYDFVPLDLMPKHLTDAVVATEDRRFFEHYGLDPLGLIRAMFANLRAGRYAQGGSTLTQQLAKNLFLSSDRTMGRKIEELLLALWLEMRLAKQDILELYLNRVYFGGGAYGVEAAARRYFDKPARQLTLAEAAVIAGLLKAPSKFSPSANPALARSRSTVVLKAMVAAGHITEAEETIALRSPLRFADPTAGREPTGLEYAIEFVLERLPPITGNGHREIIVETTFDAPLQKRAQGAVEAILASEGTAVGANQAALAMMDTQGSIRALVGGRSFAQSQFNRAVKARRQPGSAFKPIVYLTAVEQGATPDTMVLDMPINIDGWSPRNDNGVHRGAMTMRHALAQSVNSVAVRLQQDVGTGRVITMARRLGMTSELRKGPSLALGTSEVSLLELTGAYTVLAGGGVAVEPHAIERVRTSTGTIIYARQPQRSRMIVPPDHAGAVSSMLNTALVSGTGRRAALPRHPAAGKTGTTSDFRDAWFVGYTAHLATGVWVGNDNGETMSKVSGGSLPASIWRTVMMAAHERLAPTSLPGVDHDAPPARPVDTLSEADRVALPPVPGARPVAPILERPAPAQAPTPQPSTTTAKPVAERSKPLAPVPRHAPRAEAPLMPKESIDAALIERAIQAPEAEPQPSRANVDTLQRALSRMHQEGRMGLGVRPAP